MDNTRTKKLSEYPIDSNPQGDDLIPIIKVGDGNYNVTFDNFASTDDLSSKANQSDLDAHTSNTSNPHSVTKTQVGLGNVDNTSDASKPISTATQTALDGKVNAGVSAANNQIAVFSDSTGINLKTSGISTGTITGKLDKSGGAMTGDITSTASIMAGGNYSPTPTTPGVYIGVPTGLNPRFTVVPSSGSVRAVDNNTGALRFINSTAGTVQMVSDTSGNFLFGANGDPTHTVTIPSAGTGVTTYNTTDMTTNYERVRQYYNSNQFNIESQAGGTGVRRNLGLNAPAVFIANSTSVPSANPTGGGLLYVESGALKYRGSSGTVTTIANA